MFLNGELYVISATESQTCYIFCQKNKKVLILKKLEFESVGEILGFLHINKINYNVLHSFWITAVFCIIEYYNGHLEWEISHTFCQGIYSVSHNFMTPKLFAGNQGNHQNFVPSSLPHKLWLIWIGMKQKNPYR